MNYFEPASNSGTPSNRGGVGSSFSSQVFQQNHLPMKPPPPLRDSFFKQKSDASNNNEQSSNPYFSSKPPTENAAAIAAIASPTKINSKPVAVPPAAAGGAHVTYTFDFDLDENENNPEAQKRKQTLMFMQAKFIMKPLDSFLEGRQRAALPLSTQSSMVVNSATTTHNFLHLPNQSKKLSITSPSGNNSGPLSAIQLKSQMNQYAKANTTNSIQLPLAQLKALKQASLTYGENANSPTSISDPNAFSRTSLKSPVNQFMPIEPFSAQKGVAASGFSAAISANNNNNPNAVSTVQEEQSQDMQQLRQKNIFKEDVELKQKNMTSLFDIGPRYDNDRNLLKYSIVGKAEWYKKVESQKSGPSKNMYSSLKANMQANRKQSIQGSSYKDAQNSFVASSSPVAQPQPNPSLLQLQKQPSTVSQNRFNDNNADTKSVLSRSIHNSKIRSKGKLLSTNGESDENILQTVTKDHLLMKFSEIESRIAKNAVKESVEKEQLKFTEKQEQLKQERYLERYSEQQAEWDQIAVSLVDRSDKNKTLLGSGPLAQQAYTKYKNYTRIHAEDTLLVRSEDMMRAKKEQHQYIEHLKEPYEFIGPKNLWEGMLRNDQIDLTSKETQSKKLLEYFFPKNLERIPRNLNSDIQSNSGLSRKSLHLSSANTIRNGLQQQQSNSNSMTQLTGVNSARAWKSSQNARGSKLLNKEVTEGDDIDISVDEAAIANARRKKKENKIGFVFKRFDEGNRAMSTSNGARILTTKSNDLLEVIRTPRIDGSSRHIHGHFVQGSNGSATSAIATPADGTTARKDTETNNEFNTTKGTLIGAMAQTNGSGGGGAMNYTFNSSRSTSFLDKNKITGGSDSKLISIKQSYLNYFTSNEIDNMMVIGESKINVEKDTIVNDGKQRFETYQLVLTKKNSQAKPAEEVSQTNRKVQLGSGNNDITQISGIPSPIKPNISRPSNFQQNSLEIKGKKHS